MQSHAVASRSIRKPRTSRMRPAFYIPLALFSLSIVGGLAVLAAELPAPIL